MTKNMKTMDGNQAAAHIAYAFTEVAEIYPITPSSTMSELVDQWASYGKENLFGMPVKVVENAIRGWSCGDCTRIASDWGFDYDVYCFSRIAVKNT